MSKDSFRDYKRPKRVEDALQDLSYGISEYHPQAWALDEVIEYIDFLEEQFKKGTL